MTRTKPLAGVLLLVQSVMQPVAAPSAERNPPMSVSERPRW